MQIVIPPKTKNSYINFRKQTSEQGFLLGIRKVLHNDKGVNTSRRHRNPYCFVPNNRASKYVRQKLIGLWGERDKSTIIGGDFNTPLTEMDRSSRQKISRVLVEFNSAISQQDIMDIYRVFHPMTEYTLFPNSPGTFIKIDHILGHKTQLHKFKRIEIIQYIDTV